MYKFIEKRIEEFHVDEKEIQEIENKYHIIFPEILKKFYLEYNGDTIKLCSFVIDGYQYSIAKIVQLKYGTCTFEYIVDNDREDGIMDKNLMPIARNEGGDYYYWDIMSQNVFLYYCDDIENPIYICNNLEELFQILDNSQQA